MATADKDEMTKRDAIAAYALGAGLVLYGIHNRAQPLIEYAFLPIVGFGLIVMAMFWQKWRWARLPFIVQACGVIIVAFGIAQVWETPTARVLAGAMMLGLWLMLLLGHRDGTVLTKRCFVVVCVAQAVSLCVLARLYPTAKLGGIVTTVTAGGWGNYDIGAGYLLVGMPLALSAIEDFGWRRLFMVICFIGIYLTRADEALPVLALLAVFGLLRRDLLFAGLASATLSLMLLWTMAQPVKPLGDPPKLSDTHGRLMAIQQTIAPTVAAESVVTHRKSELLVFPGSPRLQWLNVALNGRVTGYVRALREWRWLGHGYEPARFTNQTVHNVPLIILDQMGPFPAIAWTLATLYVWWKRRFSLVLTAVIGVSLFDHYIWTQIAPWWWYIIGTEALRI